MAENDKIKVVGYAQRTFYNNGIEYRNFTEDLVGNQQTEGDDGSTSVFTFGNFVTTTNFEGRTSRIFSTNKFGDFYCLENLNLNSASAKLLINNNVNVKLNLDNTNLCNFAYFGSATEFIRVSLENIITNWPASLHLTPLRETQIDVIVGDTVSNYIYDELLNKSTFKVDTNFIKDKFDINYLLNGLVEDVSENRNLTLNYSNYVINYNELEFEVLNFTGATNELNDYIYFEVQGNPFMGVTASTAEYHVKPKSDLVEEFFNGLEIFENNLLNRLTSPKYTSEYNYKIESDTGVIINKAQTLTWPVSDGYNIDFDTTSYIQYVSSLLEISNSKDGIETDLMTRFLTSESISDFDTIPKCDGDEETTAGQKMNKTLKIYGREFDEIKKYIDGISFANVVTYDKKDNTPDQLVKYLARVLGWELTSSLVENNLIEQYLKLSSKSYPGYSRGFTSAEAEVELWRRLILNSAWIWKSKGTRKSVEFFFSLIGAPDGLIDFSEHVYVAEEPIDMDLFYAVLRNNDLDEDLSNYNVDADGYPKFFKDTYDMYFQKGGQWYRQTAGSGATQYELRGNNPHVGPYDGGKEYIAQLENIIPNFSAFTITATTVTTGSTQLFTNYNRGVVNQYDGPTYVGLQNDEGIDLTDIITINTSVLRDPCPIHETTDCGCDIAADDEAIIIDIEKGDFSSLQQRLKCSNLFRNYRYNTAKGSWLFNYLLYDQYGVVTTNVKGSYLVSKECCDSLVNGNSFYYENYDNSEEGWSLFNTGYVCCKSEGITNDHGINGCGCEITCQWVLAGSSMAYTEQIGGDDYLKFIDPAGNFRVVNESDSCFCPSNYTTPKIVDDPYTGERGYGCALNELGTTTLTNDPKDSNYLYRIFQQRSDKTIGCKSQTLPLELFPNPITTK